MLSKIEILSGGKWFKAQGNTSGMKEGWVHWKARDRSQGIARPGKWRYRAEPLTKRTTSA